MFRKIFIITFVLIPVLTFSQSYKKGMTGLIGISLYGGANIPVSGDYSSGTRTKDLLNTGSQFSIGVSYYITKGFGIEGIMNAGYNYLNSDYSTSGKDPVYVDFSTSLNAIYNFGHLFKKPVISPVVRIGAGSYQWEQLEDGIINAEVNKQKINHRVKSLGINIGAGAEYNVSKKFRIGLMLDYNLIFPKKEKSALNNADNSNERTTHGYFVPQLKFSYYIPTR